MNRTPIESKLLKSVGYDGRDQVLEVEWQKGTVYQYSLVSPERHAEMMAAKSIGGYFLSYIKPYHPCKRIEQEVLS